MYLYIYVSIYIYIYICIYRIYQSLKGQYILECCSLAQYDSGIMESCRWMRWTLGGRIREVKNWYVVSIWRFPKIGVYPVYIIQLNGTFRIFHHEPSIWGYPHDELETPMTTLPILKMTSMEWSPTFRPAIPAPLAPRPTLRQQAPGMGTL